MKRMVWMLGLLVLLPGCLSQKHYDAVMGSVSDVQSLKASDQQQNKRIKSLEQIVHELQSGLRTEIRDQGVTVEKASPESVRVSLPQAVLFSSGSVELNELGGKVLSNVALALKAEGNPIRIVGYSDALPVGNSLKARFTDNWELSAARAAAVARVLVWGEGIAQDRIRIEGRGAADPVADNSTEEGRAQNRRIEIYIIGS
ncbi:MAG: OmpA family protein [Mariprofundaceae bacterium]|nr:OmpA family protein [Mariprofundaceae bacterium]